MPSRWGWIRLWRWVRLFSASRPIWLKRNGWSRPCMGKTHHSGHGGLFDSPSRPSPENFLRADRRHISDADPPANPALPRPGQSARQSGRLRHPGKQRGFGGIHFRFVQQCGGSAHGKVAGRTGRLRDSATRRRLSPGLCEMQKYWHVIKIGLANTLVYRFNFFFRVPSASSRSWPPFISGAPSIAAKPARWRVTAWPG